MSHLGEEEAEAFFKKGDEGTYEGGPRSVMPSSRDLPVEEDESLTIELIAGQLERRSRMQRLVTRIVGGLGVGLFLLLPVRLLSNRAQAGATTELLGAIAPRTHAAAAPLAVAPDAPKTSGRSEEPDVRLAAPPAPSSPATSPIAAAPIREVRLAANANSGTGARPVHAAARAHRTHASAVHSQQQGNRVATPTTRPTRTVAATPLPSVRRLAGSHAPPTATFPD